jgi:hypothetical protein
MPKRISEVFGVTERDLKKEGVFSGFIDLDSKFYVDPHLLENTTIPELKNSYKSFKDHFEQIVHLLTATTNSEDVFFRQAHKQLIFPEFPFVSLGYSAKGTSGSGIGPEIALKLTKTAWEIIQAGITDPVLFELVGLIEEKIGADRISDMAIHIILPDLLAYSERVAKNLNLNNCQIKNSGKEYLLPAIPANNCPVVLIPCEILNNLPIANGWDDIDRVCAHNEDLRNRINAIIGTTWKDASGKPRKLTKGYLRHLLLSDPEVLRDLIEQYKKNTAQSYDFEKDPSGQLIWQNIATRYAGLYPLPTSVDKATPENIIEVVRKICGHFGILAETQGLSAHFRDDSNNQRNERFGQLLFFGVVEALCHTQNVDLVPMLNRETNTGRISVDIKLLGDCNSYVNVQVKYSQHIVREVYEKQLLTYNAAEPNEHRILLVIKWQQFQIQQSFSK